MKEDMEQKEIIAFLKETLELQKKAKYEFVKIEKLTPFKGNPSIPGASSEEMLKKSIEGQGFVEDVIAYREKSDSLLIIVGHKRINQAKALGMDSVPVKIYPFKSRKHALAYCVASNRLTQIADTDYQKLKECFEHIDTGELGKIGLEMTGYKFKEIESMIDFKNYLDKDLEFISESDRRSIIIKCKNDEELLQVKKVLKIDDKKMNTIAGVEFLLLFDEGNNQKISKNVEKIIRFYLTLLPPKGCKSILDIGSGITTPYKGMLKNRCKKYISLDIRKSSRVDFQGDITKELDFKDKSWEWGWCVETLEHIEQKKQEQALIEMLRICENLVLCYPTPQHKSFIGDSGHHEVKINITNFADKFYIEDKSTKTGRSIFIFKNKS